MQHFSQVLFTRKIYFMDNYICLITIVVFYGKDGFQYWRLLRSLHMYVSVRGPDNRRLAASDWRYKHQRPIEQLKQKYTNALSVRSAKPESESG